MVDELVAAGAIGDRRIERAFRAVRRDWFLPDARLEDVYLDRAVVTHRGPDGVPISSSTQPALMADMLGQLAVERGMSVLEVGTGTGYNAAILGRLVGRTGTVVTVDVDRAVAQPAERHLRAAGASNVTVVTGDGWAPLGRDAAFERIEVTVGAWDISPAWVEQLRRGGVLVVPLWLRAGQQASIAFRKVDHRLESISVVPCGFMRMRGPGAGEPSYRPLGAWTVSLDRQDPEALGLLAALLDGEPSTRPAPSLERGWFTPIALAEDDAVHLFADGDDGPVICAGVLQASPAGLAVVESQPLADPPVAATIRVFGSDTALARLMDLLDRHPAIDVSRLSISATPTGDELDGRGGALARLVRPHFTLVVRGDGPAPA